MNFQLHIGVDYSGRATPASRTAALQVYAARGGEDPRPVLSPAVTDGSFKNWCRQEIAEWLISLARGEERFLAGIDHGFSFPLSYFQRYGLSSWNEFLEDFCRHWPTDQKGVRVDAIRRQAVPPRRTGGSTELRLTERWTSSAKSVFQFDVQGSVAKSTHAGLPWLQRIRREAGRRVHVWPFDGWRVPPGKSVIAEVYPSIFRNRYARDGRRADQQDAYAVARWLSDADRHGLLERYFQPPLTDAERRTADLEGWILGIA